MVKFWANHEPLSLEEDRLVAALFKAHAECVWRENCSTMALQQAAGGSRSIASAFIAALATLGEVHGPVQAAYEHLFAAHPVQSGKVPGFGNSFIRGQRDPSFRDVENCLHENWPVSLGVIHALEMLLHNRGKMVYANPAAYTAAVAYVLGMPFNLSPLLFIMARTEAWGELFHKVMIANPIQKARAA